MKKIAFTGTSGSGKTTLVKFIEEELKLKHLNGSSGELLTEKDVEEFEERFSYKGGKGHAHVIRESHMNPEFGLKYQLRVLERRTQLIEEHMDFVTDRSPLDNFVYFMLQSGLYQSNIICQNFMELSMKAMSELTHIIYVPAMIQDVEDNNSRVANYLYQRAVDAIFNTYWQPFSHHAKVANPRLKLMKLTVLNLAERKAQVKEFLR